MMKSKNNAGFTLIEIAVSLLVLSLLLTPLIMLYNNNQTQEKIETSYTNVSQAITKLEDFRSVNGFYPCPASMTAPRNSPAYGVSGPNNECDGALNIPAGVGALSLGTGVCANGLCAELEPDPLRSVALLLGTVIGTPGNPILPASNRVIVGAIPFRALQLDEKRSFDAYGSRLLYAVTESMTDQGTMNNRLGAIDVRDENGTSQSTPPGSTAFLVLSHGPNRVGAYNVNGVLSIPCPPPGVALPPPAPPVPPPSAENENCNAGFGTGVANLAIYGTAQRADGIYDDLSIYFSQFGEPTWRKVGASENMEELAPNFIGIGTNAPATLLDVNVQILPPNADPTPNAMRVYGDQTGAAGRVRAGEICDENGGNCFVTTVITGDPGDFPAPPIENQGMRCANANEYAQRVEDGQLICGTDFAGASCNDLGFPIMQGFDANGFPICVPAPGDSCPSQVVGACGTSITLPAGPDTTISPNYNVGPCSRTQNYRCNSGTWGENATNWGACYPLSTPDLETDIECGVGYEGTFSRTTIVECSGTTSTNTRATDCRCVGAETTVEFLCRDLPTRGDGWLGVATQETTFDSTTCNVSRGEWDLSGCTCPAEPNEWIPDGSCSGGQEGHPEREIRKNLTTCAWEDTGATRGDCSCTPPAVTERWVLDGSCPDGTIAGPDGPPMRLQEFEDDVDSCRWEDEDDRRGSCVCDLTPLTTYEDVVCASPACETPNPADRNEFVTQISPVTCVADYTTKALVNAGSCIPRSFSWTGLGQRNSPAASQLPPNAKMLNQACSCSDSTLGQQVCFSPTDLILNKYNCTCD